MTAKRSVEICHAALEELCSLLPRRESQMVLIRFASKLAYWRRGDGFVLDARVDAIHEHSIFELRVDDTFGFSVGLRIAFCEASVFATEERVYLIGIRRQDEPLTHALIETLRFRRDLVSV